MSYKTVKPWLCFSPRPSYEDFLLMRDCGKFVKDCYDSGQAIYVTKAYRDYCRRDHGYDFASICYVEYEIEESPVEGAEDRSIYAICLCSEVVAPEGPPNETPLQRAGRLSFAERKKW